ncbi:MAG: hypothetical protein HC888_03700 [Candidatus Competibacteraceae bacterium]|nr:hypothetical protein [Candidatus Competibacteraceae bacterium]
MARESGASRVELATITTVGVDVPDSVILEWNRDEKVELTWNPEPDLFRDLPESVWTKLRALNLANYIKMRERKEAIQRARNATQIEVVENPFNPVLGDAEAREIIRARQGWHQCWKNPGIQYDSALLAGYVAVRKPGKDGEKPGEETGEILKRVDSENKVEAIAVETTQARLEQYYRWMSQESQKRYSGVREAYATGIEGINRGMSRSEGKIIPMDENGKPML